MLSRVKVIRGVTGLCGGPGVLLLSLTTSYFRYHADLLMEPPWGLNLIFAKEQVC